MHGVVGVWTFQFAFWVNMFETKVAFKIQMSVIIYMNEDQNIFPYELQPFAESVLWSSHELGFAPKNEYVYLRTVGKSPSVQCWPVISLFCMFTACLLHALGWWNIRELRHNFAIVYEMCFWFTFLLCCNNLTKMVLDMLTKKASEVPVTIKTIL